MEEVRATQVPPDSSARRSRSLWRRLSSVRADADLARDAWLAVAVGVVIRIAQFFFDRSLFIDEAALALNIRNRSFLQLTETLDHAQSAPLGFLFLQRTLWTLLGDHTLVLRLPALMAGIAALILFVPLARRLLPAHLVAAAVALLGVSQFNIFWATDAKQYAFDVLSAVLLALLSLRFLSETSRRNAIRLGIAGAVLPFFSIASVLVLAGIAPVLAVRSRHALRTLAWTAGLWLLALPEVVRQSISLSPEDKAYFQADWWDGFLSLPLSSSAAEEYWRALIMIFFDPVGFGYPWPTFVAIGACIAGAAWLIKRHRLYAFLLLGPAVVTWLFALLDVYPITSRWQYSGRVTVFLTPAIYLCITACAAWLRNRVAAVTMATAFFLIAAIPSVADLPYSRSEAHQAFDYVRRRAQPSDRIYLYYGVHLATRYYQPEWASAVTAGKCSQSDPLQYYRELEQFRGSARVWLILAQNFYDEHERFIEYMDRNAVMLERRTFFRSIAVLYDFRGDRHEPLPARYYLPVIEPNPGTSCQGIFRSS